MRVALVTDRFSLGGGLEHIYQICSGMPEIEFGVFARGGTNYEKFKKLLNTKVFNEGYDLGQINDFNPDIVHIHHIRPLMKLYKSSFKMIFTVHGIHVHKYEFIKGWRSKLLYFFRMEVEKYLYKHVLQIITVSDEDQLYLHEKYNLGSECIYNGISVKEYIKGSSKDHEHGRKRLALPNDKTIYLMVARFDFPKGHDVLIKAAHLLKERNEINQKYFVLVGSGSNIVDMQQKVHEFGLGNYFLFVGESSAVFEYMQLSDCLILPSRWEGLPITLLEAMQFNLPIIGSNTYGVRSVHRVNREIVLFENENPEDLSKKILHFRKRKKDQKVAFPECFTIKSMITKLEKLYARTK